MCETKSFYVLLSLLLIITVLLNAFSVYFCLIKHKEAKQNIYNHIISQITN